MSTTPEEVPPLPDSCWPVDTSCVPDWNAWDVEPDPDAVPPEPGVPVYSDAEKARAVALAGLAMRMLTAYRVGGCPITVRPSSQGCRERTWRTYPVDGTAPWSPLSVGGRWINLTCGHDGAACGCIGTRQVRLWGNPGRASIVSVKVDGLTLDPSAYRLDPGALLVRLDGQGWPLCQDLTAPDTAEGTWSVTYTPGAPVDGLGAYAAGVLAGQYVRLCAGGQCDLPSTATQVQRDGVTLTLAPGAFPGGRTGIREVDVYLERWNPHGLRAPSTVWSPDVRRPRRTY